MALLNFQAVIGCFHQSGGTVWPTLLSSWGTYLHSPNTHLEKRHLSFTNALFTYQTTTRKPLAMLRTHWASFTNSLRQRKQSFGVSYCQVLLKTCSDELALLRLNMHFYEFRFQTQNIWEESIQMNHAMRFPNVCAHQITGICAII